MGRALIFPGAALVSVSSPSSCVCILVLQDLQESEGCQDELALRVQQLKAELVLFKGLMSNVRRAQTRRGAFLLSG